MKDLELRVGQRYSIERLKGYSTGILLKCVQFRMQNGFCPKSVEFDGAIDAYLKRLRNDKEEVVWEDG